MANSNRGVLATEQSLGWLFKKGMSRGGLAEFEHDRLIAEVIQGIDLIKQKAFAINQQSTRLSRGIQANSDALFEELGNRIWLGRGHKAKPAWVADGGLVVCGGRYARDLCFTDPQDHRRLKSLFHQMVLAKCRAFRQNRRQKNKPRQSCLPYTDSIGTTSKDDDDAGEEEEDCGGYDGAAGDEEEDLNGGYDDNLDNHRDVLTRSPGQHAVRPRERQPHQSSHGRSRYSDADLAKRYSPADRARFSQGSHDQESSTRHRLASGEGSFDDAVRIREHKALPDRSMHTQHDFMSSNRFVDMGYRGPSSPLSSSKAVQLRGDPSGVMPQSTMPWNAQLSPNDEQKLIHLTVRSSPREPRSSRDAILDLLQRIDLQIELPGGMCKVCLERCVSRDTLFNRINQTVREHHQSQNASHATSDDDKICEISFAGYDLPEELLRMQFRRDSFRDQYPGFLLYMRQIDNGWDTFSLSVNVRTRS